MRQKFVQFMAYCKSKIIGNEDISSKILKERNIRELIKIDRYLGSQMNEKERKIWKLKREKYAFIATREKFLQNSELQRELLKSGNRLFVEATDFENYWSAGVNMNSHNLEFKSKWKGKNMQGQILTYIRVQIKLGNIQALNTQEKLNEKKNKEKKLKVK